MTTLYWGLMYAKVIICYIFIIFVWPSAVFRGFLKNRSVTFRFSFCAVLMPVIINTAVLMLGLFHLLKPWIVNILFYGTLVLSFRKEIIPDKERINDYRKLISGTLRPRQFIYTRRVKFTDWVRSIYKAFWKQVKPHFVEYLLLFALAAYAVVYFSYSPFVDHAYGFGDMYTHHSWIYGLVQGQIFSAGVYPEGMHCVVYFMHTVSGLPVFDCNLFLGCMQTFIYVVSAYCLMKEIFRWRGTSLIVLAIFLFAAAKSSDLVISMARLQRSLPGEYGLYSMFLCALYLLKFLKEDVPKGWHKKPKEWFKNENLIIFSMSLAASIAIHFYVTITAFFVCLPFAIIFFGKVIRLRRFLPLVTAGIIGVSVAVVPMVGALISGIPFQGSIGWALNVISGTEYSGTAGGAGGAMETDTGEDEQPAAQPEPEQPITVDPAAPETLPGETIEGAAPEAPAQATITDRIAGIWQKLRRMGNTLLRIRGFSLLIGSRRTGVFVMRLSLITAGVCIAFRIFCMIIPSLRKFAGLYDNYLPIIGAALLVVTMYSAPGLDIPELIAYIRLPSTAYILMLMVTFMPFDFLLGIIRRILPNFLMQFSMAGFVTAVCAYIIMSGNYHGFFYNELTRYRAVVNVTSSITESFPQFTYTIVSSTDEIYSTIEYGRHEELLLFLKNATRQGYYLPTEYVFIYVEKKPILHAQYHFSSGPRRLGNDVYSETIYLSSATSVYPEILHTEISEADAEKSVMGYPMLYSSYRSPEIRTIINSKAYKWCQDFKKLYDSDIKVYYEDDDFVCYCLHQNPASLYDLGIWQ